MHHDDYGDKSGNLTPIVESYNSVFYDDVWVQERKSN